MKDLSWVRPDGKEMSDDDWNVFTRCFRLRLAGDAIADVDAEGRPVVDDLLRAGRANRSARAGRQVQAADVVG